MSTATPRHTTRHPERPNVYRLVHPRWSIAGHAAAEGRPRRLTRMPTKPGPVDDSERKRRRTSSHSTSTTIVAARPSCARTARQNTHLAGTGEREQEGGATTVDRRWSVRLAKETAHRSHFLFRDPPHGYL